ncbi:MAG: ABC transporter permease [Anaerolineae bacterium]
MLRFILRRIGRALITLILYQSLLFLLIYALPGDFVSTMIGLPLPLRQGLRAVLGLNAPWWQQYLRWMGQFFTGNLGTTYQFPHRPVSGVLRDLAPPTLFLFLPATLLAFGLGIWLGKFTGWSLGKGERLCSAAKGSLIALAVMAYNSFPPWLAFVLVQIFALRLRWFPAENVISFHRWSTAPISSDLVMALLLLTGILLITGCAWIGRLTRRRGYHWLRRAGILAFGALIFGGWYLSGLAPLALDLLWHLALPLTTVVLFSFGETMLLMRLLMRQMADEDYVFVARAKGLPPRQIRDHYLARLAVIPVLSRLLIQLPFVLLGSLVVETAFFWKGLGSALLTAIDFQDIPVIMALLSLVGVLMLIAHIAIDILHAWLDPRVRAQ